MVDALDKPFQFVRIGAAVGRRGRRCLGQLVREIERREHGDALARLDLARIADCAHFTVDDGHRFEQIALATIGAGQHIALAEDRDLELALG